MGAPTTRVLGFDLGLSRPGTSQTALAVVELGGAAPTLVDLCEVPPCRAGDWHDAAEAIRTWTLGFLSERPGAFDLVAYEKPPFYHRRQKDAYRKLNVVAHQIVVCARRFLLPTVIVQPAQSKAALAGHGHASKELMIERAQLLFRPERPISEHEADAIGVALAGEALWRQAEQRKDGGRL